MLLYLLSGDAAKADRAEAILAGGGTVSAQVLNEFAAVARRKLKMTWPEVREVLATARAVCAVVPVTETTHDLGVAIAERYGFSVYDAMIVAAASLAGCATLYTEDLQDGQTVHGVTVRNPFRPADGQAPDRIGWLHDLPTSSEGEAQNAAALDPSALRGRAGYCGGTLGIVPPRRGYAATPSRDGSAG